MGCPLVAGCSNERYSASVMDANLTQRFRKPRRSALVGRIAGTDVIQVTAEIGGENYLEILRCQ